MDKYFAATYTGVGFITHADQEEMGLSFNIMVEKEGIAYVKVTGEESAISTWKARVSGTEVTLAYIEEIIASIYVPSESERLAAVEEAILALI